MGGVRSGTGRLWGGVEVVELGQRNQREMRADEGNEQSPFGRLPVQMPRPDQRVAIGAKHLPGVLVR